MKNKLSSPLRITVRTFSEYSTLVPSIHPRKASSQVVKPYHQAGLLSK